MNLIEKYKEKRYWILDAGCWMLDTGCWMPACRAKANEMAGRLDACGPIRPICPNRPSSRTPNKGQI